MAIEHHARAALSIALVATIVAYPDLRPEMPPAVAFALPITGAVIWYLLAQLGRHEGPLIARSYQRAGATTTLFLSVFHVTMVIGFVAGLFWLARILGAIVGAFLIVTGNDLPRARPNLVWGVRPPCTLGSEDVWRRVHRLGGYVRFTMGIVVCGASLSGTDGFAKLIAIGVGLEAMVCIAAGIVFSRHESAASFHGTP